MAWRIWAAAIMVLGLAGTACREEVAAQDPSRAPDVRVTVVRADSSRAQKMLAAAEETWNSLMAREGEKGLTSETAELEYRFSGRMRDGRVGIDKTQADAATKEHLARMRDLQKRAVAGKDVNVGLRTLRATDYYVAEAERLAGAKSTDLGKPAEAALQDMELFMEVEKNTPEMIEVWLSWERRFFDAEQVRATSAKERQEVLERYREKLRVRYALCHTHRDLEDDKLSQLGIYCVFVQTGGDKVEITETGKDLAAQITGHLKEGRTTAYYAEMVFSFSSSARRAEMETAVDGAGKLAAARAHQNRLERLREVVVKGQEPAAKAATDYYLLEAEATVEAAK